MGLIQFFFLSPHFSLIVTWTRRLTEAVNGRVVYCVFTYLDKVTLYHQKKETNADLT